MAQATSFDTLLTQCRDLVCERLTAALADMLDKADDALLAMLSEARDAEAQRLYMDTREKVLSQREAIKTQFQARYLREFQQRSNRVKKIGDSFSDVDLSSMELELVGEDDLNETLKFNAMAARLRQFCEEELVALDQRVGVLLGDASLQPEDNPFTPQAICDAYKHTCRQVDSDVDVRMVLLDLFDDHVVDDIRAVYKAVNALLVQNSILPKIRVGSGRQAGKTPQEARTAQTPAPSGDKTPEGEQDLFSVLQKLLTAPKAGTAPGGVPGMAVADASAVRAGASAGQAAIQGAELLRSLTRIQLGDAGAVAAAGLPLTTDIVQAGTTNVLRELKGSSLGSGMNHMDAMTLDIMAMLFDQLFDDPKIPIGVKGLIGRLQIPMLKVAISDKAFFSKKTHPARQMLDTLGEISARLPADFDVSNPMYGRLEAILHELIDGFEDDLEIFNGIRERLQALVAEEDKRIEQEAQSSAKKVEQKENLAVAKTVAQAEIKVRIRGARVPVPVLKFLIEEWIKLLIVVEVKHGENSEEWKNALKTIELLVWSVEPKETAEDRRKLVAMLPDLLKRLTAGAQLAGIEDEVRTRFFADLRKLHTQSIGKAAELNGAAVAEAAALPETEAAPASAPSAPAEMAPLDFASTDTAPGRVEAKLLEPEAPHEVPSPAPAEASPLLPELPELSPAAATPGPLPPDLPELTPSPKPEGPLIPELPDISLPPAPESPTAAESTRTAPAEPSPLVPELPDVVLPPREATPHPPAPQALAPQPSTPAPRQTPPPAAPAPRPAAPRTATPTPRTAPPQSTPPRAPAPRAAPAPPRSPAQPGAPAARAPQQAPMAPRMPAPGQAGQAAATRAPVPPAVRAAAAPARQSAPAAASGPGALDFTAAVTVKNPFGEGRVEVDDLDFTTKLGPPTARAKTEASDPDLPADLVVGTWVDIREKDSHRPAKLSFVSPLRTRFLFINRQGKNTLECSRAELVRRFRLGEITIMRETSEAPLFDRLIGDLVNKLGGPTGQR